jgi:hypothetical protein
MIIAFFPFPGVPAILFEFKELPAKASVPNTAEPASAVPVSFSILRLSIV